LLIAAGSGAVGIACAVKKYYSTGSETNNIVNVNVNVNDNDDHDQAQHKYDPVINDITEKFKNAEVKALEAFYNRNNTTDHNDETVI